METSGGKKAVRRRWDRRRGEATQLPTGGSTADGSVSPTDEEPAAGTTVTGRVVDRRTGLGVPGAVVVDATDLPTQFSLPTAEGADEGEVKRLRKRVRSLEDQIDLMTRQLRRAMDEIDRLKRGR